MGVRGCPRNGIYHTGKQEIVSSFLVNGYKVREGFPLVREQEKAGTDNGTLGCGCANPPCLLPLPSAGQAPGQAQAVLVQEEGSTRCSRCILERFTQTLVPEQVPHPGGSDGPHGFAQAAGTGELWGQRHQQPW